MSKRTPSHYYWRRNFVSHWAFFANEKLGVGGGGGELPHSCPFAIFWSIPKTEYYNPPPPFKHFLFVYSRFHPDFMALFFTMSRLFKLHLPPLLTLDNRDPSPHGFTSKMCWCIAEMLVLNSADAKLSQKDSCIQWFQSLWSVLGLFLCRGQTAISTFVFIGTGNWSKKRDHSYFVLVQKGANYE